MRHSRIGVGQRPSALFVPVDADDVVACLWGVPRCVRVNDRISA